METSHEQKKRLILETVEFLQGNLDSESIEEVKHYVKYNELKLSIEMLCDFIADSEILISTKTAESSRFLAESLDVDGNYYSNFRISE